ncbi:MAG: hypothetical protein AAGU12_07160 [Clostridiales bacterium]
MLKRMAWLLPYCVSLIAAAFTLYVSSFYLGLDGHCRDAGLVLEGWPSNGLWIGFFLSIASLPVLAFGLLANKKKLVIMLTLPLIIALGLFTAKAAKIHENFYLNHESFQPRISSITLEEVLDKTERIQIAQYIYIGSEDCRECAEVYPQLANLSRLYQRIIYSYDLTVDRQSRPGKTNELLDKVGVSTVPSLVKVENGEITVADGGPALLIQLEEWLNTTTYSDLSCFQNLSKPRPKIIRFALAMASLY